MGKGSFQLKRFQGVVLLHFPHLLNELLNDSPETFKAVVREVKKRFTNRSANLGPINRKESKWAAIAAHIAKLSNNLLRSADQLSNTERKTVKRVIERVQKDSPKRFVIALALCLAQSPEGPVTRATIVEVLVPLLSGAGPRGKKISIIDLDSFKCSSFFIEMSCHDEGEKAVEDAGEYMYRVLMGNQTLNELTGVRSKDGRWVVIFVNSGKLAPHQPSVTSSGKRLCEDYTFVDPRNFGTGGRGEETPPSPDADSGLFFKFFPTAKGDAPETKMQKGFGARSTGKFLNQDSLSNYALDYLAQKLLSNSPVPVLFVRAYGQYECDYTLAALIEDIADKFFPPSEEEAKPDIEICANDSDYLVLLLRWQEEALGSITFRQVLSEGSSTGRSDSVRGEGEEALLCIQFGRAIFQVECDLEKATAQIENRKAAKRADAPIKEQALRMIFPTNEIYCRPLGDLGDKTKPARLATPEEIMERFKGDAELALVTLLNKGHILPPSSDRKARLVLQGWSASGNKELFHAECNYADAVAERRRLRDAKTVSPLSSNELDQIFKGTEIYSDARAKVPAREEDLLREFGTTESTAILEEMLNYGYTRRDLMEASLHASEFDLILDAMEVDGARMGFKRAFKSLYVKHNSNDNVLVKHLKHALFASNMRLVAFKEALQGLIDHIQEISAKHQSPPDIFFHPGIFRDFAKSSPPHLTEEEKQNGAKGRAWLEYLCLHFWSRHTGRDAVIKRYRFSSSESDSDTNQNLLSRIRNCRPRAERYTNHSLLVNDLKEANEFFWRNLCKISNADSEGKRLADVFTLSGEQTTREHYESGVLFFQCREAELPPAPKPRFEGWRNRPMDSLLAYMEGTIRCTRDRGERDPETFHQILEVESKIPEIAKNLLFCCNFWNLAGKPKLFVQNLMRLTAPLARLDPFEGEPQRAAECLLRGSPRGAGAGDSLLPEPRFEALRDAGLQRNLLVSLLTSPCLPLTDAQRYLAIRCLYWEPYYFAREPPRKAGPPRDQATFNDHPAPSTLDHPALKPSASCQSVSSICSSDEGSVGYPDEEPSELHLSREGRGLGFRRGGGKKWGSRGSPDTRSPTPPPSHFGPSVHGLARLRTADPPAQPVTAEGKAGNGIRVGAAPPAAGAGGANANTNKFVPRHRLRPAANDTQHKSRTSYRVSDANTPRSDGLGCLRKKD